MHWNTHLHSFYLCIFSYFLSIFLFCLCLLLFLSCCCLRVTHNNRWTKLKHTHLQTHIELQASQLSACCCHSEAQRWSLFQSDSTSASFAAVWKNLALIYNKIRKTVFLGCSDFSFTFSKNVILKPSGALNVSEDIESRLNSEEMFKLCL